MRGALVTAGQLVVALGTATLFAFDLAGIAVAVLGREVSTTALELMLFSAFVALTFWNQWQLRQQLAEALEVRAEKQRQRSDTQGTIAELGRLIVEAKAIRDSRGAQVFFPGDAETPREREARTRYSTAVRDWMPKARRVIEEHCAEYLSDFDTRDDNERLEYLPTVVAELRARLTH